MIKPKTSFKTICPFGIYPEDIKVLSLLYQPLIGSQAFGLYLTLVSLTDQVLTHHFILQLKNISVDQFLQCRYKLEGVGLMAAVQTEEGMMVYCLKEPLTPARFFDDGIINAFLCLKIGNTDYQQLRRSFLPAPDLVMGCDLTKNFNEVFDTTSLLTSDVVIGISPLPSQPDGGLSLQLVFDREVLDALLRKKGLSDNILSEKLLTQLNKIAFLYKLEENDLARFILDGMNPDGFVNIETVKKTAKQYWQFLNKGKPLSIVEVDPEKNKKDVFPQNRGNLSPQQRLLDFFEQQTPLEFLKYKSNNANPVPADRKLVEWLFVDQEMPHGVVNVLLDYVLMVSDGRLPKPLIEKIAGEWQRKSIDSTQKAIKQVKSVLNGNKERQQQKKIPASKLYLGKGHPTRQEPVPEWLGQSRRVQEPQDFSAEDLQAIERMNQLEQQILNVKR